MIPLDGCHMCRSQYPLDALPIDMECGGLVNRFKGQFHVLIHAAKSREEHDRDSEERETDINFDYHLLGLKFVVENEDHKPDQMSVSSFTISIARTIVEISKETISSSHS